MQKEENTKFTPKFEDSKIPKISSKEYSFNKSIMVKVISNRMKNKFENQNSPLSATRVKFNTNKSRKPKTILINQQQQNTKGN